MGRVFRGVKIGRDLSGAPPEAIQMPRDHAGREDSLWIVSLFT